MALIQADWEKPRSRRAMPIEPRADDNADEARQPFRLGRAAAAEI